MPDICLITGGGRSGKSEYAEKLAAGIGRVLYIATGPACDDEMKERIARHQEARPKDWQTWEKQFGFEDLEKEFDTEEFGAILLDCVGNMLMGILYETLPDLEDFSTEDFDKLELEAIEEIDVLCDYAVKYKKRLIIVTNEIGMGLIPETRFSRYFRDALGRVNKHAAARSDYVVLMVAGIPLKLK